MNEQQNADKGLTAWTYLTDAQRIRYKQNRAAHQRAGQAWFNALDAADQQVLRGTPYDPFYSDSKEAILLALAHLLEVKRRIPPAQRDGEADR